jgi:hypothetical protein
MKTGKTLNLSQVTLCAADCVNPSLAERALLISSRDIRFADVVLFTDSDAAREVRTVRTVPIARLDSVNAYSTFMLKELHRHIRTPWALVAQWDGYVIDPRGWHREFFEYDYIGAPWSWHTDGYTVGNGGFSLRSKRLLDMLASPEFPEIHGAPEDEVICRIHRPALEARGIRFAPVELAQLFSYENSIPDFPTFGFHSASNLWRHVSDAELADLVARLDPRALRSPEMRRLLTTFYQFRKFDCLRVLYLRNREFWTHDEIAAQLTQIYVAPDVVALCAATCAALWDQKDFA